MIGWLIDALGVQRVGAEVDSLNDASLRLLERLGFQRIQYRENADTFKGRASHEWTLRLEADHVRQAPP
jgi:RimJ/RimL family protein N-acetyltransferase